KLLNLLPEWKNEHPFLREAHSQILQQSLIDLDRAYQNFFRRLKQGEDPGYPRYKKKFVHDSFRFPQGFKVEGRHIYLPKLGWFRFYKSQDIDGTMKNVTVSRRGKHWYISVQVEQEIPDPIPTQKPSVGIDMGVARFCTLSDGTFYTPLNSFKRLSKKLARLQRGLARKVKFSENWKRAKARITRLHEKIADVRRDYLHKLSRLIADKYGLVVVEDLRVCNMSASARGTLERPGRNVKAKSGLNRSILDQGWSEFFRQLEYKLSWLGGWLEKVNPSNTSRTCPVCGHTDKENRRSQSRFRCVKCLFEGNADYVAAINIHTAGHAGINACGDGRPSLKQELPGNSDTVPTFFPITPTA
ncbi:RNA-guided endonuclease InsQ/TnpB family protein, partial [Desulfonatronovibrio hydrogenovorans]|uniref:RNA-guided endonuclease InsQ/TnpB family protein n=1 Tax=Desulfonatronovibrio hydrogenovorans TaxID=53245 RepID=UPI0005523959